MDLRTGLARNQMADAKTLSYSVVLWKGQLNFLRDVAALGRFYWL